MTKSKLTDQQAKMLAYVSEFREANGFPPSLQEIATWFAMSISGVVAHLSALEKKGRITRCQGKARSIVVIE